MDLAVFYDYVKKETVLVNMYNGYIEMPINKNLSYIIKKTNTGEYYIHGIRCPKIIHDCDEEYLPFCVNSETVRQLVWNDPSYIVTYIGFKSALHRYMNIILINIFDTNSPKPPMDIWNIFWCQLFRNEGLRIYGKLALKKAQMLIHRLLTELNKLIQKKMIEYKNKCMESWKVIEDGSMVINQLPPEIWIMHIKPNIVV